MKADDVGNFLSRWSRRKLGKEETAPEAIGEQPQPAPLQPAAVEDAQAAPPEPLPPVESLTPESDFKPFMRPEVDDGVKRAALKTLFSDPQFNVMDGLDTYIDDYSIADPIPAEMMKKLYQAREHLFTPEEKAAADAEDAAEAAKLEADKQQATQPGSDPAAQADPPTPQA